jgi:hypothetical protein
MFGLVEGGIRMILQFTEEQAQFLGKELDLRVESGKHYEFDKKTLNNMLDCFMDVETEEAMHSHRAGKELSQRGETAVALYDLVMPPRKH